jgi:Domain of unknown function (DUF4760)
LAAVFLALSAISFLLLLKNDTVGKLPVTMSYWETLALTCLVTFVVCFIQVAAFFNYRYRRDAVVLVLLLVFFTAFFWNVAIDIVMQRSVVKGHENALALLSVGWAATLGWIVTNWLARESAKTSHTLNAVLQLMTSKEFQDHRRNVFSQIAYNQTLSELSQVDRMLELYDEYDKTSSFGQNKAPPIDSIRYIFNYFEYIARGIRANEFDNRVIRETIGPMIGRFYDDYKLVFVKSRLEESQKDIYDHLEWLLKENGRSTIIDENKLGLHIRLALERRRRNGGTSREVFQEC